MTLRILFTLAILAGLAAAPAAQPFHWQAGDGARFHARVAERVHRAVERAHWRAERVWDRLASRWDRGSDRPVAGAVSERVRAQVAARVSQQLRERLDARLDHAVAAAGWQVGTDRDPCGGNARRQRDEHFQHCEVRELPMPAGGLTVDATPNGSITVEAWDRNDILVKAVVRSNARDESRATALAARVQVQAGGGRVTATGPDTSDREWWSVGYRISVPRKNDLALASHNGGVSVTGVTGRLTFETSNGGVRLADVGGDVRGTTRNGGVSVVLGGQRWDGAGLDVETTNGGVTLAIPDGYRAQLETRTTNGGVRSDYPVTVQGDLRRGISTTLGAGGATVRVRTVNGGLTITRRDVSAARD